MKPTSPASPEHSSPGTDRPRPARHTDTPDAIGSRRNDAREGSGVRSACARVGPGTPPVRYGVGQVRRAGRSKSGTGRACASSGVRAPFCVILSISHSISRISRRLSSLISPPAHRPHVHQLGVLSPRDGQRVVRDHPAEENSHMVRLARGVTLTARPTSPGSLRPARQVTEPANWPSG